MKITDYKVDDKVKVLINNPKNNNLNEWRDAKVIKHQTIHWGGSGIRHEPYVVLVVEVVRTYYRKLKDLYNGIVWVGETFEFHDKLNTELIIYADQIKKD